MAQHPESSASNTNSGSCHEPHRQESKKLWRNVYLIELTPYWQTHRISLIFCLQMIERYYSAKQEMVVFHLSDTTSCKFDIPSRPRQIAKRPVIYQKDKKKKKRIRKEEKEQRKV